MTVGEIRETLENSKNPVFIIEGKDKRFRTYMPSWQGNNWGDLPEDLKKVFSAFSDRPNFIDCLYEIILESEDGEDSENLINKIKIMENNSNLGSLYIPNEKIYFCSDYPNDFWARYPLRFYNNKTVEVLFKTEQKKKELISPKNLKKWLKFHPCQRVYLDLYNEDTLNMDFDEEEKKELYKYEVISLYDDEKY